VRTAPEQLRALSRALKEAGDRGLRKELNAGLNRATKPMTAAARQNYRQRLPKRGGLNQRGARARMTTQKRTGRDPSIRIVATGMGLDLRAVDAGLIRHPVFQSQRNPDPPWVSQRIRPDTFTDAMIETAPQARREVDVAMQRVADKVEDSTRGFRGVTP
jgi:hypothetical protein